MSHLRDVDRFSTVPPRGMPADMPARRINNEWYLRSALNRGGVLTRTDAERAADWHRLRITQATPFGYKARIIRAPGGWRVWVGPPRKRALRLGAAALRGTIDARMRRRAMSAADQEAIDRYNRGFWHTFDQRQKAKEEAKERFVKKYQRSVGDETIADLFRQEAATKADIAAAKRVKVQSKKTSVVDELLAALDEEAIPIVDLSVDDGPFAGVSQAEMLENEQAADPDKRFMTGTGEMVMIDTTRTRAAAWISAIKRYSLDDKQQPGHGTLDDSFVNQLLAALYQIEDKCGVEKGDTCRIAYQQWDPGEAIKNLGYDRFILPMDDDPTEYAMLSPVELPWMIAFDEGSAGADTVDDMVRSLGSPTPFGALAIGQPGTAMRDSNSVGYRRQGARLIRPIEASVKGIVNRQERDISDLHVTANLEGDSMLSGLTPAEIGEMADWGKGEGLADDPLFVEISDLKARIADAEARGKRTKRLERELQRLLERDEER